MNKILPPEILYQIIEKVTYKPGEDYLVYLIGQKAMYEAFNLKKREEYYRNLKMYNRYYHSPTMTYCNECKKQTDLSHNCLGKSIEKVRLRRCGYILCEM